MNRRTLLRAAVAGTTAGLTSLAGCTGNTGSTGTTETTATEGATTDTETGTDGGESGGATVAVRSTDEYGDVLVGPDGMSLYLFEKDEKGAGSSTCAGDCAGAWPPLTASGEPTKGDGVTASLSTFDRGDGATQVAANGWPLYYFSGDDKPGDTNGQEVEGFGAEWYLLGPDGAKVEGEGGGGESESTTTSSGY